MNSKRKAPLALLLLGLGLIFSFAAHAVSDGNYHGNYQGKAVTAVLETMSTTVTGMLTIGEQRYLLKAESEKDALSGQLNSMSGGAPLALSMTSSEGTLQVVIGNGGEQMRFTLQPD